MIKKLIFSKGLICFMAVLFSLILSSNNSLADPVPFNEGMSFRVNFDYSGDPLPAYDQIYLLLDFVDGTMNPGEQVVYNLYDDPSTLIGQYTVYNNTTIDYAMYGKQFFIAPGSAFTDSKGFWILDNIIGSFDVVSAQTQLALGSSYTERISQSINAIPEPITALLFGTGLTALAGLKFRRKKKASFARRKI